MVQIFRRGGIGGGDGGNAKGVKMRNGMIRITVRKKVRKYKSVLLYLTVGAPPLLGMLFLDAFAKHPGVALGYLLSMIGWDTLFAIANKKKPRRAIRGKEFGNLETDKNFRVYDITSDADLAREEVAS